MRIFLLLLPLLYSVLAVDEHRIRRRNLGNAACMVHNGDREACLSTTDEDCMWCDTGPGLCKKIRRNKDGELQNPNCVDLDPLCLLPAKRGPCDALFPRYYFNADANECEAFTYGGCAGNENNFITLSECQNTCPV
jgi:hypothetical protein